MLMKNTFQVGAIVLAMVPAINATAGDIKSIKHTPSQSARTPAEYAAAQVFQPQVSALPQLAFDYNEAVRLSGQQNPQVTQGRPGSQDPTGLAIQMTLPQVDAQSGGVAPQAVGVGGVHFTSSRISPKAADKTYPISAVGKLYFTQNGGNYMCSAALIKPGVVLTAAHCLHSGNGSSSGWSTNIEFIPGFRQTGATVTAPFGRWSNSRTSAIRTAWYNGGGSVPSPVDFGVVVFNTNASGKNIGDYTGWLGTGTNLTIGRHLTVLGYPGNLDRGGQLHRVDSLATSYGSANNGVWGSDMQGGSSGGPAVLNWRVDYVDSTPRPSEDWGNVVTGVVSWGYVDKSIKVQGGSQFGTDFTSLMDYVCTNYATACGR